MKKKQFFLTKEVSKKHINTKPKAFLTIKLKDFNTVLLKMY